MKLKEEAMEVVPVQINTRVADLVFCSNTLCQTHTEKLKNNLRFKNKLRFCPRCLALYDKDCFCDHCG
jgi:hypothetical protein